MQSTSHEDIERNLATV